MFVTSSGIIISNWMEDNDIFWKRKSGGGFEKFFANEEERERDRKFD